MIEFAYEDIKFEDDAQLQRVNARFYKTFKFYLSYEELQSLGDFKVENNSLFIDLSEKKRARFDFLLEKGFTRLIHTINQKNSVYIHRNSGIPLMGTNEFGLVDRGTNIIEVKPITGCNLNCVYCSVDEGINKKLYDYVVEPEYLAEEFAKLAKLKEHPVEANIGPQGEPLIYPKIVELVKLLSIIDNVEVISVNTNGILLNKVMIDNLCEAGLTRINLSLNSLTQETADKLAGKPYPLKHVRSMIEYAKDKISILLAPTIVPGYNDNEMEGLVNLSQSLESKYPTIGFQNFLNYSRGRNPVKQRDFEEFFSMLKQFDKSLILKHEGDYNPFNIHYEKTLEKPFKRNDTVEAVAMLQGRYNNETVLVSNERCITINENIPLGKKVKIKIVRDKHNIFRGVLASSK